MNKLISTATKTILILFIMCLLSCNGATDKEKCLGNVKHIFPKSKIYQLPDERFVFYVVDSTGVKKVTTTNLSDSNVNGIFNLVLISY